MLGFGDFDQKSVLIEDSIQLSNKNNMTFF